jgi:hypothetical protein
MIHHLIISLDVAAATLRAAVAELERIESEFNNKLSLTLINR